MGLLGSDSAENAPAKNSEPARLRTSRALATELGRSPNVCLSVRAGLLRGPQPAAREKDQVHANVQKTCIF